MNPGSHAPSSTSSSPSSRRDPGVTLDPRAVSSRSRSHHPNTNSPNSRKKFAASSIEVVGPPLKTGCCSIIQRHIYFLTTPGETGGRNFPKDDITQRPSPNIYVLPSVLRAFVRQLHLQKSFSSNCHCYRKTIQCWHLQWVHLSIHNYNYCTKQHRAYSNHMS